MGRLEETERIPERTGFLLFEVGTQKLGGFFSVSLRLIPTGSSEAFEPLLSFPSWLRAARPDAVSAMCSRTTDFFGGPFLITRSGILKFIHEERSLRVNHFEKHVLLA